ncbi:DUF899 domain-containing protein [Conexibacter woesei]|uniref:DUF899 domain-containing protein n=1 Tax=Conexibacter woesei TaxID=191495 RepID=UPI00047D3636
MTLPTIVGAEDFDAARRALLAEEKALTHQLDALAAKRRRLPMTPVRNDYILGGEHGEVSLLDLFAGRRQLAIYHFMFPPGQAEPCVGCSTFTDNIPPDALAHLAQRDTAFTLLSPAPLPELLAYRDRMGWSVPWHSAAGTTLTDDLGIGGGFRLSILLRDGDDVYLTYWTGSRGVDRLRYDFNILDLTPLGRQEQWEDTPPGRPQTPTVAWLRRHDEYANEATA